MKLITKIKITSLLTIIQLVSFGQTSYKYDDTNSKEYKNEIYLFSVRIPNDWKLFGQILDDSKKQMAIADWGLPKIYSEIEKTSIENSISITAYRNENIKSLDKLIELEYLKINPAQTSMNMDSVNSNARIIYNTRNGLKYKGKTYFAYKNGVGYVITFMATPGTFDNNLIKFEEFYKRIVYLK